jgi:DNA-binding MarR family transcriptional regulator
MKRRAPTAAAQAAEVDLQERMIALIRAFGLHKPNETPCGKPVSVAEAHALIELSRAETLVQKELASRLRLEKSTVSRLVGLLEGRRWVERSRNPEDGRAVELRLTEVGRKTAPRASPRRGGRSSLRSRRRSPKGRGSRCWSP